MRFYYVKLHMRFYYLRWWGYNALSLHMDRDENCEWEIPCGIDAKKPSLESIVWAYDIKHEGMKFLLHKGGVKFQKTWKGLPSKEVMHNIVQNT